LENESKDRNIHSGIKNNITLVKMAIKAWKASGKRHPTLEVYPDIA
jgi:hypothetical protein